MPNYLADKIIFTREEVRAARKEFLEWRGTILKSCFLDFDDCDDTIQLTPACLLCRYLTDFARGASDEEDKVDHNH